MKIEVMNAHPQEEDEVLDVITSAFSADPVWSWAFPSVIARQRYMRLLVNASLRFPYVFKTANFESVCIWIPPGEPELNEQQEASIPNLLNELVGLRADVVSELFSRFGNAHPHYEPHYYLSLFGTHKKQRGCGIGMALLRDNLARIDADKMPAYLESTNPMNNLLYESVGFKAISSFTVPENGAVVTGMWREKQK